MAEADDRFYGNASSIHRPGQAARVALERARKTLAQALGAATREIIFTSGATESNNLVLFGLFGDRLSPGDHVVTSRIEHPSVLRPLERLVKWGVEVSMVAPEPTGEISSGRVAEALRPNTRLISMMAANNETGVLNDVAALGALAADRGILFQTDAVQAFGRVALDVAASGIHFLSASAHKLGGPKGVGLLYARKDVPLETLHLGGSQENNHRGGTENVSGAIGFARAAEITLQQRQTLWHRLAHYRETFLSELDQLGVAHRVNGDNGYPGIINLRFPPAAVGTPENQPDDAYGQSLMMNLDLNGVAVSYGSACASGSVEPSGVLMAMGLSEAQAARSLRFSFGYATTEQEVLAVAHLVHEVVQGLSHRLRSPEMTVPAVDTGP